MNKPLLIICICFCSLAQAKEPFTVIFDSGNTLPVEPYLPEEIKEISPPEPRTDPAIFQLPISTPSMRPGVVNIEPVSLQYLQRPLFLVGVDDWSKQWLIAKREQLIEINAIGLIIEAQSLDQIREVMQLAEGLEIAPASAESFAPDLGLTHYPILLSKHGWEQ